MWRADILRPVFPFAVESRDDLGMRIGQIVHLGAVGGDVVEMPRAIGLALVPRPPGRERDEFPAPVANAAPAVMLAEKRRAAVSSAKGRGGKGCVSMGSCGWQQY